MSERDWYGLSWFLAAESLFSYAGPRQAPLGDWALLKPQLVRDHVLLARELVLPARELVLLGHGLDLLLICG